MDEKLERDFDETIDEGGYLDNRKTACCFLIALLIFGPALCIISVIYPNLIEARKHGNEASAMGCLRTINEAQAIYLEKSPNQGYGDLHDLYKEDLIDNELASGVKYNYRFYLRITQYGYDVLAVYTESPKQTETRTFYTTQRGVIRLGSYAAWDQPNPHNWSAICVFKN
jgi:hypothetical protein